MKIIRDMRIRLPAQLGFASAGLLLAVFLAAAPAYACDCRYTALERFEQAKAAFTGLVEARNEVGEYELRVTRMLKGSERDTVTVFGDDRSNCGLNVEAGAHCLVFADEGPYGLETDKCSAWCDPATIVWALDAIVPYAESLRARSRQQTATSIGLVIVAVTLAVGIFAWRRQRRRPRIQ